ncbi:DeoR/GlpR family DNA-binding transcription regulator [Chitinophaga sp. MM2321]|uniref:DeoR/GlpR family DNA-binding transcription regulator n=1 Tax=Chitinophaga sp. MM2321 TaxID=3137178 RepID=UPI0032D59F93
MLKRERQAYILHEVNLHNKVLSSHLSEQMQVSEDTIRRDLTALALEGKILKVHGGGLSNSFHQGIAAQDVYAIDEKRTIAQKAITLIKDGMYVLTTGGTTIVQLARILPAELRATFITVSLPAAFEYANHPNIDVIVIGDRLAKNSKITVGGEAISKIRDVRADLCFLGVNALDVKEGLTDNDWDVVQVKKAMVTTSRKVVALCISEKLNTVEHLKVCNTEAIDILITELPPKAKKLQPYSNKGIRIL